MSVIKMTVVLVSTNSFVCTLTYPIKSKNTKNIEELEAEVAITPIFHKADEKITSARNFFRLCSLSEQQLHTRANQEKITHFLDSCTPRIREQMRQSSAIKFLEDNETLLKNCFFTITLYDKDTTIVETTRSSLQELLAALVSINRELLIGRQPFAQEQTGLAPMKVQHQKPVKIKKRDLNRETRTYFQQHKAR